MLLPLLLLLLKCVVKLQGELELRAMLKIHGRIGCHAAYSKQQPRLLLPAGCEAEPAHAANRHVRAAGWGAGPSVLPTHLIMGLVAMSSHIGFCPIALMRWSSSPPSMRGAASPAARDLLSMSGSDMCALCSSFCCLKECKTSGQRQVLARPPMRIGLPAAMRMPQSAHGSQCMHAGVLAAVGRQLMPLQVPNHTCAYLEQLNR